MQGFVLRLPAEAADRAIVAVMVECPGHADIVVEVLGLAVQQSRVVEVLDQARTKGRGGNAEDNVVRRFRSSKAGEGDTQASSFNAADFAMPDSESGRQPCDNPIDGPANAFRLVGWDQSSHEIVIQFR